jgi:hypothetical protein
MTPEQQARIMALTQLIQTEHDRQKLEALADELHRLLVEISRWNSKPPEK